MSTVLEDRLILISFQAVTKLKKDETGMQAQTVSNQT